MIQKAFEQRWPIKPEYREVLVKRLIKVIASPDSTNREATAAAKALIAAESQNQKDEQTTVLQSDRNRFLEIAQRLGISQRIERIDRDGTGSSGAIVDAESRSVGGQ